MSHDEPAVEDMPLDVWLRFPEGESYDDETDDDETDDEPDAEANTYLTPERLFVVKWSHTAVGLVSSPPPFVKYSQAEAWLISQGFTDYSS